MLDIVYHTLCIRFIIITLVTDRLQVVTDSLVGVSSPSVTLVSPTGSSIYLYLFLIKVTGYR